MGFENRFAAGTSAENPEDSRSSFIEPGTEVAGFVIESVLEANHSCTVYKAYQPKDRRHVALRIINPEFSSKAGFVDRFLASAGSYSSIEHPAAQQCYGAGTSPSGEYYAATEYVEGCNLAATVAGRGYFSAKEGASVFFRVASALDEVYSKTGLVHGDISMENIIITPLNEVKVINFGRVVSFRRFPSSRPELITLKPGFAPEILSGLTSELCVKTDMYSFGAVFYNVLTGSPPYSSDGDANAFKTVCVSSLRRDVPDSLSILISRMISEDPDRRPASWSEVMTVLAPIAGEEYTPPEEDDRREHVSIIREKWFEAKVNPVFFFGITAFLGGLLLMAVVIYSRHIKNTIEYSIKTSISDPVGKRPDGGGGIPAVRNELHSDGIVTVDEKAPEAEPPAKTPVEIAVKTPEDVPPPAADETKTAPPPVVIQQEAPPVVKQPEITPEEVAFKKTIDDFIAVDIKDKSQDELSKLKSDIEEYIAKPENKALSDKVVNAELRDAVIAKTAAVNEAAMKKTAEKQHAEQDIPPAAKEVAAPPDVPPDPDAGTDELNLILSTSVSAPSEFAAKLVDWIGKYSDTLPALVRKAEFFRSAALKYIPSKDIVMTNQDMVKGYPLPGNLAPGLVIESFNSKGIKMTSSDGGLKVGTTIQFQMMKDEDYSALAKSVFTSDKNKFLSLIPDHQNAVIASCILAGDAVTVRRLLAFREAQEQDIAFAEDAIRLMKDSQSEADALKTWKRIKSMNADTQGLVISETLAAFIDSFSKTGFSARHESEIMKMKKAFPKHDLESLAEADIAALKEMVKPGNTSALSRFANVYARYSESRGISAKLKSELSSMMNEMVASLRLRKSPVMPFYPTWEETVPGSAWSDDAPALSIGESLGAAPPHTKFDSDRLVYRFIAETDAGMWNGIREYMTQKRGIMLNLADNCAIPGAYSMGMAAERFLMSSLREPVYTRMSSFMFDEKKRQNEAAFAVCMEYSLFIRNSKRCAQIYSKYSMTGESRKLAGTFRISLLNILRAASDPATSYSDFSRLTSAMSSYYSASRFGASAAAMQNDIAACSAAGIMMFSDKPVTNAAADVMKRDFSSKDITSRIAANAVAKALYDNRIGNADAKDVVDRLRANVSDGNAGSELWETLAMLKIASASNYEEMYIETCRLLDDKRICAIQAYPRLLLLKAGLLHASTGAKIETVLSEYSETVAGYPAASQTELSAQKLFSTRESSRERIENLIKSGFHKEAAWLGAAVSLLNKENSAEILALTASDSANFNWVERLMISRLENLRKAE